ncbi:hypothetical protein MAUB_63560 (plasmid) [Mycolicibacterium aubagnense]|uniref:Sulfocyanin n=1 Tax=Mycolicibacterium aubagnense TaxID=319707 RepID=A0ABM7IMX5_9MYCO|nr:hypothetical protein MAUB_63560 [Mycolicibacterium aubagnense]
MWLVVAIAASSLVLGLGATAIAYRTGPGARPIPPASAGPYPAWPAYRGYPGGTGMWGSWGPAMMGPWRQYPGGPTSCAAPALPGTVVDVNVTDMGSMMGPGRHMMMGPRMMPGMGMMRIYLSPATVPAGPVSFRVLNTGAMVHELVVLPLPAGQFAGRRPSGPDGTVDETGSLGEASRSCAADRGDEQSPDYGIAPGALGWTTITLPPGRYELVCNIAGHYVSGMSAELDVTGPPR